MQMFPNLRPTFPGCIRRAIQHDSETDRSLGHIPNRAPVRPGPWGQGRALRSGRPPEVALA